MTKYITNPTTGRKVLKNGRIGKKIQSGGKPQGARPASPTHPDTRRVRRGQLSKAFGGRNVLPPSPPPLPKRAKRVVTDAFTETKNLVLKTLGLKK